MEFFFFLLELREPEHTRLSRGSPGAAFGQRRETVASLSPLSWQHIHERSVCHNLDPETWIKKEKEK